MKKVSYHKSHSFQDLKGNQFDFQTQLYEIGVYCIVNNNAKQQFNLKPKDIAKLEKRLSVLENKKQIKNLVFGEEITVSDETGFWKEINT